jgi:hypothetical protein
MHISPAYGKRVFQNLRSPEKEWLPVPQGSHFNLASVGGESYKRKIIDFLRQCTREHVQTLRAPG